MSSVPLLSANLVIAVLESFLYAIYVVLASFTLYLVVIRHRERANEIPAFSRFLSPLSLGTLALLVAVTAHWILNVVRLFLAFQISQDGARLFYSNLAHETEILKYVFLIAAWLIGDSLVIHRMWAVWAFHTRIIVFPILTLLGFLVFGVGLAYQLSTYDSNDSIFTSAFQRWTTGICFFSLWSVTRMYIETTNLIVKSGFVWYKLWTTNRALKSAGVTSLSRIMRIFIDSAVLMTAWGLFHVISYHWGSNLQFIAVDGKPAVTGISNALIQIRLHFDLSEKCVHSVSNQIKFATDVDGSLGAVDPEMGTKSILAN
ncbi:hypothetical protein B0H13DRAFT_2018250 [Mycena leptocephala]|nr:hypothetical protein B0H13DRAFT_2018250 [Mycena leptocephala]